ncbi:MAG: hypothetical protein MUO23_04380, partial [Anaerolineales bacterium]|nr:hypothetical protein [Anaerolineales bacterium]
MITTSRAEARHQLVQDRRERLEKLVQISSHAYDLALDFGTADGIGPGQIVLRVGDDQAAAADYLWLRGEALHLLGHFLQDVRSAAEEGEREQADGKPHFLGLWHALEDARMENWMVGRWPGMQRSFAARQLPNLGGGLLKRMPVLEQVEYGIYLTGRGLAAGHYRPDLATALEQVRLDLVAGAGGEGPASSLQAMRHLYPKLGPLLPQAGRSSPQGGSDFLEDEPGERRGRNPAAGPDPEVHGPPQIELDDGLVEVTPLGWRRELPEWYRPGSAPWFERGVGEKQVHPSAVRSDRQTLVEAPRQEAGAYRLL